MKKINWITRSLGVLVFLLALYTMAEYYLSGAQGLRGISNNNGVLAAVLGGAALGIWLVRKLYVEMKKRGQTDFSLHRQAIQFFRSNHILFGWLTLFTTTAHGLYYLFVKSDKAFAIYTGWTCWVALCGLTVLGIWFEKRLDEHKKTKQVRLYHIGLAFLFAGSAVLHLL